jgi:hypothetical protein
MAIIDIAGEPRRRKSPYLDGIVLWQYYGVSSPEPLENGGL